MTSLRKTLEPDLLRGFQSSYVKKDRDAYRLDIAEKGWVDTEAFLDSIQKAEKENNPEQAIGD